MLNVAALKLSFCRAALRASERDAKGEAHHLALAAPDASAAAAAAGFVKCPRAKTATP